MPMEQLHSGELYSPNDVDILKEQAQCLEKLYDLMLPGPAREKSGSSC